MKLRTSIATIHAIPTPASPPVPASTADSTRYWLRMSRRRAPSDLRMPISCVRSVTTASMMFMITIPPTTMNTETIPIAMAAMVAVSRSHRLTIVSDAKMRKVIVLRRAQVPVGTQQHAHFVLRGVQVLLPAAPWRACGCRCGCRRS